MVVYFISAIVMRCNALTPQNPQYFDAIEKMPAWHIFLVKNMPMALCQTCHGIMPACICHNYGPTLGLHVDGRAEEQDSGGFRTTTVYQYEIIFSFVVLVQK